MDPDLASLLFGGGAALVMAFSKTGMPGSAILAVMLMAHAFPGNERLSVGVMVPLLLLGDLFALAYYRRHAQWDRLGRLCPYVVAGMVPAIAVLQWTEKGHFGPVLGWLVLLLLLLEVCREGLGWTRMAERWWFAATMGLLAGFGTMIANAAGPAMSIYLIARGLQKEQFVGTCAWFYFIVNLSKVPVYCWQGMITAETLLFDLKLAPFVVFGALLGVKLLPTIPPKVFNVLVLILAGAAAVQLIWR